MENILLLFLLSTNLKKKKKNNAKVLLPLPSQDAKLFLIFPRLGTHFLKVSVCFQPNSYQAGKKKAPQLKQETLSFHSNRSKLEFPTCWSPITKAAINKGTGEQSQSLLIDLHPPKKGLLQLLCPAFQKGIRAF